MAFKKENDPTQADSIPDLDDWGVDDYWKCEDWITWHGAVKSKYGKEKADRLFVEWWNKQSWGASPIDCRTFNTVFRNFLKKENLLDASYGGASIIKPLGAITDVLSSGSDIVSDTSKGVGNTAKTLKIVLPLIAITLFVGVSFWAYKKFVKTA